MVRMSSGGRNKRGSGWREATRDVPLSIVVGLLLAALLLSERSCVDVGAPRATMSYVRPFVP